MKARFLLAICGALALSTAVFANESKPQSLALVRTGEAPNQSKAMVVADERLYCETLLTAGNWIQRFLAKRRLNELNKEYSRIFAEHFSRFDQFRQYNLKDERERHYVLRVLRDDYMRLSDKDLEFLGYMSQHDPSESVRELALKLFADPPTPEKRERDRWAALRSKAPQRELMLPAIHFNGGQSVSSRLDSLRVLKLWSLSLSKEQLAELALVAERDANAEVRSYAKSLLDDPVGNWLIWFVDTRGPEPRLAFLEYFERNFDSLTDLQKRAIVAADKADVKDPIINKIVRDLAARLESRDGPYR